MKILKSVRFKLTFIALLTVFVITSLIVWSDVQDTRERMISTQKEKAILLSDIIKQSIMILMIENRWKELQTLIEELSENNPELKEVRIFHPSNGQIIVSAGRKEIGEVIYREDLERFKKGDETPFVVNKNGNPFASRVSLIKNMPACYRCHPSNEKILGGIDLEVSLAVAQRSIMASTYKHLNGLALGFVVISLIFLISGEKLINRPLKQLTGVIKKVELGDLSARADGSERDEFGYLAGAFNNMIEAFESARKEIEQCHLQQMEKAAKLASLGEIMSGIAHEIKNPLTGISCAVQVFHSELGEDDGKRAITSEILNQVKRLDMIVKDLLSYAKPKPPRFLSSRINDVIEKALFFVYPEAKKQNIFISTDIANNLSHIMMDPDQMQQVLLNITINAIQAMPTGGMLKISVSEKNSTELAVAKQMLFNSDKILVIVFQDTGKGIPPEDMESIFEPFFTKKSKGTGLGLSISQRIVQEHGGEIAVSSESGKGSVFTIYLPVNARQDTKS